MRIRPTGKYFSAGNTKSIAYNSGYKDALNYWATNGYRLRYSGGMAPDCYHVFQKGEGIFTNVAARPKVDFKLRLLYETDPICFLCELAGGASSNGEMSVLDIPITAYAQKNDIIMGSKEEVERCVRQLQAGTISCAEEQTNGEKKKEE